MLRLHESEHFGAEVFAPVRPANAAAGHVSHAQVHAFDARAVDEDFVLRAGQRQVGDGVRIELERNPALGCSVRRPVCRLIVVSAQRRADHGEVAAQDAVFVEARHLVECAPDALGDALRGTFTRLVGERELRLEQPHQRRGDGRLRHQHAFHVGLAERDAGLQQVTAIGAHHHDVARAQARAQQQPIEAIVFDVATPGGEERFLEQGLQGCDVGALEVTRFELEVLDPHHALGGSDLVRMFGQDAQPEIFEHGQDVGNGDRLVRPQDSQREVALLRPRRRAG